MFLLSTQQILLFISLLSVRHLLIGALFCVPTILNLLSAQPVKLEFERMTTSDGLPQNNVYSIVQDSRGFMWFGTHEGLCRFDGYTFKLYQGEQQPGIVVPRGAYTLHTDREGTLWVGDANGLYEYNRENDIFTVYLPGNDLVHDTIYTQRQNSVYSINEDRAGVLWIGTAWGLTTFNRSTKRFELHFFPDTTHYGSFDIRDIHEDKDGGLWLGTQNGAFYLDPERKRLSTIFPKSYIVKSISEDKSGNIWFATLSGLQSLNKKTNRIEPFLHYPGNINSPADDRIHSVLIDYDGYLWVGTQNGLDRVDLNTKNVTHYRHDPTLPSSLSHNRIYSLYQDRTGVLWIGTFGGGISKTLPFEKGFNHIRLKKNTDGENIGSMVMSVLEDSRGTLWMGTWEDGLVVYDRTIKQFKNHFFPKQNVKIFLEEGGKYWASINNMVVRLDEDGTPIDTLPQRGITKVFKSSDGHILTLDGNQLLYYDTVTYRFKNVNNSIFADYPIPDIAKDVAFEGKDGVWWFAGKGITMVNRGERKVKSFQPTPIEPRTENLSRIYSIVQPIPGILWMGTKYGLSRFDVSNEQFSFYTTENGLPLTTVYGVIDDNDGNIWISTGKGLSRFNPATETFTNYTPEDGLQENEFNRNSVYKNSLGELFFGGINGVTFFQPREIRDNTIIPSIVITHFQLINRPFQLNKPITETKELTLAYDENFFSIEFAALDFTNINKNQFAHKMDGLEQDWTYSGTRRFVNYTALEPGTYTFRVKGTNNDGVWNEQGASLTISIIPPY